jgi:hypothetical protein
VPVVLAAEALTADTHFSGRYPMAVSCVRERQKVMVPMLWSSSCGVIE